MPSTHLIHGPDADQIQLGSSDGCEELGSEPRAGWQRKECEDADTDQDLEAAHAESILGQRLRGVTILYDIDQGRVWFGTQEGMVHSTESDAL